MQNVLPLLILLPLLAGLFLSVWGEKLGSTVGHFAVALLLTITALTVLVAWQTGATDSLLTSGTIRPRIVFSPEWFSLDLPLRVRTHPVHWQLALGTDGISSLMILLTTIISSCVGIAATRQVTTRLNVYLGLVMMTQAMLMGVFLAMDILTFYIFFEAVLLPVILMIYLWGDRKTGPAAARRFLMFTLAGSIPMVVGLIGLILYSASPERDSTVLLPELSTIIATMDSQVASSAPADAVSSQSLQWVLYTLLLGFGIKMAIVPLHSWLPTTYLAAHPNTTALIAAVVGKLGVYGIIRLVLPLMPMTMASTAQLLFAIAGSIAIVYGALIALAQTDPRRLFAYSSISHLGFITIGLMSYTEIGLQGAILQMFNHGIIVAGVFLLIAALELRYGREQVSEVYQGLASQYPMISSFFIFFLLAGVGLPGLNSFVGEFMTLSGLMSYSMPLTIVSATGILFGAWYSLHFIQQMFFGTKPIVGRTAQEDLHWSEKAALLPLVTLCIVIGVLPMLAIDLFNKDALLIALPTVDTVTSQVASLK